MSIRDVQESLDSRREKLGSGQKGKKEFKSFNCCYRLTVILIRL